MAWFKHAERDRDGDKIQGLKLGRILFKWAMIKVTCLHRSGPTHPDSLLYRVGTQFVASKNMTFPSIPFLLAKYCELANIF
jgi:hypothetical protein